MPNNCSSDEDAFSHSKTPDCDDYLEELEEWVDEMDSSRRLFVVRHGERCDFTFNQSGQGSWMRRAFDANGRYRPFDVNLPRTLPKRSDGWKAFASDTPLTEMGYLQSKLTGRSLKDHKVKIDYVYCSSALRCVQTAVGILKGMGLENKVKLRIEPGLFEWMAWTRGARPSWISAEELHSLGYPVDTSYAPIMTPHDLRTEESLHAYYERSHQLVQRLLGVHQRGSLLVVAHGASLDTLTRQLTGAEPRNKDEFFTRLQATSYLACLEVGENHGGDWELRGSPIPALTHSANAPFDPLILVDQ